MSDLRTRAMIAVAIAGFLGGAAIAVVGHLRGPEVVATPSVAPTEPTRTSSRMEPPDSVAVPIVPAAGDPLVAITDPRLLARWDAPLALDAVLSRLDAAAPLETIARTLEQDLARIVAELAIDWETDIRRTYDPSAAKTAIGRTADHRGNGNVARVLDARWLGSPRARWLLAAVVARLDRRDFVPGTCGELRIIYRLAYEAADGERTQASRLPLTLNAVFHVPDDGVACRSVAARWRAPALTDGNADSIARTVLAGPLALDDMRLAQIELDAQIVRFPSDLEHVEGRGFAGQALYWLRIFAPKGGALVPIGLENTPDVQAIRADPAKRAALRAWIAAELPAIDRGAFLLPQELLATVALSWSTLGSARLANRPFAALLERSEADAIVAAAKPGPRTFVDDGAALLERLDGASCSGCHQSSSTAGFHMLGVDRPFGSDAVVTATDGNRLQLPFSPHFAAEQPRRLRYLAQLERGDATDPTRPHPSAPPASWDEGGARYESAPIGQPCLVDDIAAASRWSCAAGLRCATVVFDPSASIGAGQCVPAEPIAGVSCVSASLAHTTEPATDLLAWNVRGFTDRVVHDEPLYALPDRPLTTRTYNCRPPRIGVPLGRITRNCTTDERALAGFRDASPPELCAIVGGKGFEQMATGMFDAQAFAAGVGRGLLDTCSDTRACREDYICQQLPDFLAAPGGPVAPTLLADLRTRGLGFCTPTYFVYQLRLDGHPAPE